jgi:uncharacterized protein (DUF1697 family)
MKTYISLLRGINVSGQNRIRMPELKGLYESLKLVNVATYIQSGNVVFDCDERDPAVIAGTIEAEMERAFGLSVKVFLRDRDQLQKIIDTNPFVNQRKLDPEKLHVTFLAERPEEEELKNLLARGGDCVVAKNAPRNDTAARGDSIVAKNASRIDTAGRGDCVVAKNAPRNDTAGRGDSIVAKNASRIDTALRSNSLLEVRLLGRTSETSREGVTTERVAMTNNPRSGNTDEFVRCGQEIYLFCPNGYGKTKLSNNFFERKLKVAATTRNWKTVNALYTLAR